MKQFFTAIAANLVTIALCVLGGILLIVGLAASFGASKPPVIRTGSVLIVNLDQSFSDRPGDTERRSAFESALLSGGEGTVSLRAAINAITEAADDEHISGILIRGNIGADGYQSGYAALRELRAALMQFRTKSRKPIHAFLVNPETRDYYVASAASSITIDPFGSLVLPGMSSEQVFFAGLFEKYGIGMQVSRVGKFKAAVEPFIRTDMSPENREQTRAYLGDLWSAVKSGIAESRGIDTVALQSIVDAQGIILPADAMNAKLVDRVAYFDEVLVDLERMAGVSGAAADSTKPAKATTTAASRPVLPQIMLEEYAPIVAVRLHAIGVSQAVAIVYAEGDIVDGMGGPGNIGGDAYAKTLRRLRDDKSVKAIVLRVNSPGGSAIASETIRRELALIVRTKPVVVSMSTVAASGGYWISTASSSVFAEPNTITGSIGVFSLVPNIKGLANKNGITFDSVKTGRFADIFTASRPRTAAEMAVLQRSVDQIYDAFIERVATARHLSTDSVRNIAEGRVWSGEDALRIGLVDTLGGLDAAVRSAASAAKITGDFETREYPRVKSTAEVISELIDSKPEPVASLGFFARRTSAKRTETDISDAAMQLLAGGGPARGLARDIVHELSLLTSFNDPRNVYARMPFVLRVR